MKFDLNKIAFVTVTEATRSTTPSASVRSNGKIMFSDSANAMIGYDGKKEDRLYFKLGKYEEDFYLVPAKKDEANTFKAAKNNASFQFNDIKAIASLGMAKNTRYTVTAVEEEGVIVAYKLVLKSHVEKDAEDKINKEKHAPIAATDPQGDARIAAQVARKAVAPKPAPTKKELDAAAKKAAKADFKAAR